MSLRWQELLCGLLLFSAVSSQGQTAVQGTQPPPNDKPSVQVFLTTSDKHGSPATLGQSELSVFVDKQLAHINKLRSAKNDALLFAVLVDTSKSDADSADLIRKAALKIFQTLSTDGNQGYLVLFNVSVAISARPLQLSEVRSLLDGATFGGGTALYDAIAQACVQKLSRSGNPDTPRRAILLISDGEDNQSHITHTNAEAVVEKEGVAVFSLVTSSSLAGLRGGQFLKEVSHGTGGQAVSVKNLADGVALLLTAIEDQWALSFVPDQFLDQKLHSLDIKSSQKDVRVSAPAHIVVP